MSENQPLRHVGGYEDVVRRLVVVGAIVAAVSIAVTFVTGMIEETVLPYDRLNPDSESSLFNWLSSGSELIAAFVCAVHAVVSPRARKLFVVLTGLLLYVSFDDAFGVHESVGTWIQGHLGVAGRIGHPVWAAAFGPLLLLTAYLLWRGVAEVHRWSRRLLVIAFVLVSTAIAFEVMGATPLGQPLPLVMAEEAFEFGAFGLIGTALTIVLALRLMHLGVRHALAADIDDAQAQLASTGGIDHQARTAVRLRTGDRAN